MDSREFLVLSDELSQRSEEASWRTAASRAYYAAFHRTRDFLTSLGFQTRRSDQAHAGLYRRLSCTKRNELNEASRLLMDLRGLRNAADYDIVPVFPKSKADQAVYGVQAVFELLGARRDAAELNAITNTIRDHERDVLREVTWQKP